MEAESGRGAEKNGHVERFSRESRGENYCARDKVRTKVIHAGLVEIYVNVNDGVIDSFFNRRWKVKFARDEAEKGKGPYLGPGRPQRVSEPGFGKCQKAGNTGATTASG